MLIEMLIKEIKIEIVLENLRRKGRDENRKKSSTGILRTQFVFKILLIN